MANYLLKNSKVYVLSNALNFYLEGEDLFVKAGCDCEYKVQLSENLEKALHIYGEILIALEANQTIIKID